MVETAIGVLVGIAIGAVIRAALERALKGEEDEDEWIPAEEGMPDYDMDVLVTRGYERGYYVTEDGYVRGKGLKAGKKKRLLRGNRSPSHMIRGSGCKGKKAGSR